MREDVVYEIVRAVHEDGPLREKMSRAPILYGSGVGAKIIEAAARVANEGPLFDWLEHQKLGLTRLDFWEQEETRW